MIKKFTINNSTNLKTFYINDSIEFNLELIEDETIDYDNYEIFLILSSTFINKKYQLSKISDYIYNKKIKTESDFDQLLESSYDLYISFYDTINEEYKTIRIKTINLKNSVNNLLTLKTLTHAQKMLIIIEELLEKRAKADYSQYSLDGMSITKLDPLQLAQWRDYYKKEVQNELIKTGKVKIMTKLPVKLVSKYSK